MSWLSQVERGVRSVDKWQTLLEQAALRLKAGPSWTDLDLVFTDGRGYPHNHDRVRRSFYRALETAEVRKVVLYALRHTMATIALDRTNLKLVATRLGHANEMLVLRTYGHVLPGLDRRVADELRRPSSDRLATPVRTSVTGDATRMQNEAAWGRLGGCARRALGSRIRIQNNRCGSGSHDPGDQLAVAGQESETTVVA